MTHQDIIKMLEQEWQDRLEAAVKQEREACAEICENYGGFKDGHSCAAGIRARGGEAQ